MNRPLAFVCALLLAFVAVSSPCMAQAGHWIRFSLEPQRGNPAKIHADFRDEGDGANHNNWSTGFMPSDLIGLDVSSFHGSSSRPFHFALVREAGRLDCTGVGENDHATGNCIFGENPDFIQLLVSNGIGRPNREQAFGLMAVNARRGTIDALTAAHYPMPTINALTALAALGADGAYINGMARAGYRPSTIRSLIEFKALEITPDWIAGFARVGYANVPGEGLVQLRALGVTPEYIAGFQRLGYRDLPVNQLVELKALDVTPEFVRNTIGSRSPMPPVNQLVQLKMFGQRH